MVRNRKNMHPALSSADSRFTIKATCDGLLAKWENKLTYSHTQ